MIYLWTEDTGSGLQFWEFMMKELFPEIAVVSKGSNEGIIIMST